MLADTERRRPASETFDSEGLIGLDLESPCVSQTARRKAEALAFGDWNWNCGELVGKQ